MAGEPGDYRVLCDASGSKVWASETALTWDRRRVHRRFLGQEATRHPQEFVRAVRDNQSVPNPRPESADQFIVGIVRPDTLTATVTSGAAGQPTGLLLMITQAA